MNFEFIPKPKRNIQLIEKVLLQLARHTIYVGDQNVNNCKIFIPKHLIRSIALYLLIWETMDLKSLVVSKKYK